MQGWELTLEVEMDEEKNAPPSVAVEVDVVTSDE
jgi:hypothetical protein